MGSAINELIYFLEYTIKKETDPEELEELNRTLKTARKVEQQRRNLICV